MSAARRRVHHRITGDCRANAQRRPSIRNNPAVCAELSDESLCDNSLQRAGKLATLDAEIGEARDGAACVIRVKCCKHEVTSECSLNRNRGSLAIAYLSDENDVRI